jgi:hypothetical protein
MEGIVYRLNRAVDAIRGFLTDFYYISDRPGCLRIGEEEFRRNVGKLKGKAHLPPEEHKARKR